MPPTPDFVTPVQKQHRLCCYQNNHHEEDPSEFNTPGFNNTTSGHNTTGFTNTTPGFTGLNTTGVNSGFYTNTNNTFYSTTNVHSEEEPYIIDSTGHVSPGTLAFFKKMCPPPKPYLPFLYTEEEMNAMTKREKLLILYKMLHSKSEKNTDYTGNLNSDYDYVEKKGNHELDTENNPIDMYSLSAFNVEAKYSELDANYSFGILNI